MSKPLFVYILWLYEWPEGSKILCVYWDKDEAEAHKKRCEDMSIEWDECHYSIEVQEVV